MANRYDVCAPRPKKDGGTFWVKIGTAFPAKQGDGFNIIFDALPLPDAEGRCAVSLFPPKEDNGGGRQQQRQSKGNDDLNDDIPWG